MNIVLFDIDGTLVASGGAGKLALETAFTEDFQTELRVQVPYSGRTDRAIVKELFEAHGVAHTPPNLQKLLAGYLRRLPDCLERMQGVVLPGVLNLLNDLRRRERVAVGLLTGNVRAGAKVKLGYFGLFEHFSFGGFGDHHFDRDDVARDALAEVRAHVSPQVAPERIWIIGDTPLDVRCARAIGAKVLAVATGTHTFEELAAAAPDLVLADLSDPQSFLNAW
jgi:phosphoglycolate phosphatase